MTEDTTIISSITDYSTLIDGKQVCASCRQDLTKQELAQAPFVSQLKKKLLLEMHHKVHTIQDDINSRQIKLHRLEDKIRRYEHKYNPAFASINYLENLQTKQRSKEMKIKELESNIAFLEQKLQTELGKSFLSYTVVNQSYQRNLCCFKCSNSISKMKLSLYLVINNRYKEVAFFCSKKCIRYFFKNNLPKQYDFSYGNSFSELIAIQSISNQYPIGSVLIHFKSFRYIQFTNLFTRFFNKNYLKDTWLNDRS